MTTGKEAVDAAQADDSSLTASWRVENPFTCSSWRSAEQ